MSADRGVEQTLRRSLVIRIGIALAVLLAVAIVAATMLGGPQAEKGAIPAAVATAQVPLPETQPKAAEAPVAQSKPSPAEATSATDPAPAESKPGAAAPSSESQPADAVPRLPAEKPQAASTNGGPGGGKEAGGGASGASTATEQSDGDKAGAQTNPAPAGSAQAAAAAALRSPPGAKPPRGPHLQAGVFLQPSNAQSFKSNLEAQGLPVYIESRVHVGPFRDRKEAERVREQLREMGVSTVLIAQ